MKTLNVVKLMTTATYWISAYETEIQNADSFEKARMIGNTARGYIECMNTLNNTFVCREDSDFTVDIAEVLDIWTADMLQALASKAVELDEPADVVLKYLGMRDQYRDN